MKKEKKFCKTANEGDIVKELNEIRKVQEDTPYILTLVTNTCSDIYTVICC